MRIFAFGMETEYIVDIFAHHGVKPTANRILIARAMEQAGRPLSMGEVESLLDTVDKSVISRTLTLFKDHHLVHVLQDGGDAMRYELCLSHHEDQDDDLHVHFYCKACGRTYCLHGTEIPPVTLPEGYRGETATYIIKGICPSCRGKA